MKRASTLWTALCLTVFLFSGNIMSAQNVLWSSDFNGGLGTWTTQDDSRTQSGDNWVHTTVGPTGTFTIGPIASSSSSNGWALFDSDALCGGSQNAWLISEAIDLSGTDTAILVFQQYYRRFHDETFVQVSNDGGATWTAYAVNETAADGETTENPNEVSVDISATAAGNASVQIAFQFLSDDAADPLAGCGYAWQIDDVRIDDGLPPPPPPDPNILWTADFNGGANCWTNNSVSLPPGIDTARWFWEPRGYVGNGILAGNNTAIQSPTASNGAMVFNADLFTTGGDGGMAPSGGAPYPEYVCELISPTIDLSGNNFAISLKYYQLGRILNASDAAPTVNNIPTRTTIAWSTDGGITWSDPVDANPTLAPNANRPTISSTVPIPGVRNTPNFKVKFTFASDFYYWVIDDVEIIVRKEHNMQANTFFGIAPNAVTPASQVEPFGFVCDVSNIGGQTATNVNLNVTVKNQAGTTIYTADKAYGSIAPDSTAENQAFGNFTPPAVTGLYTGAYTLTSDSVDIDPADNVRNWNFEISDKWFAKEKGYTRNVAPSADDSYAFGNCYYVVNSHDPVTGAQLAFDTITFGVVNADELAGRIFTLKLLEWQGDVNGDSRVNFSEYNLVAFNSYQFNGSESDQLLRAHIEVDGNDVPLKANTYYIALAEYRTDDDQAAFMMCSDAYDYAGMNLASDSLGRSRYAPILDVGLTDDFNIAGFSPGWNIVPMIRMSLTSMVSTKDLAEDNLIKIFPNPANDFINVDFDLTEKYEGLYVNVTDLSGKVLRSASLENIQKEQVTFSVRELPTGTYHVRIVTKDGSRTLPFIIQR